MPKIGVVTVTFNSAGVLPDFLRCTFAQTLGDFVLYAIDNASSDDSVCLLNLSQDTRLKVIANSANVGVAEANNQGISAALQDECDTVLLVNNDTAFPEDLFARLHEGLDQHRCDMTTGKIYYFSTPDVIWSAGGAFDAQRLFNTSHHGIDERDVGQYERPQQVTYSPTCCLLARASVFQRVGLMDSRYFVYTDDVDFLYRCMKESLSLWYIPAALMYHKVSSLTGGDQSSFAVRYMTRNRMYFLRKHRPWWEAIIWAAHLFMYTAPRRVVSKRDSWRTFRLRCRAAIEGWNMPTCIGQNQTQC